MYTYYSEVSRATRFKTARELALYLRDEYKITTTTGRPPILLVSAYLNALLEEKGMPKLFIPVKGSLQQVFQNESDLTDLPNEILFTNIAHRDTLDVNDIVITIHGQNYHVALPENSNLLPPVFRLPSFMQQQK